MLIIMAFVLLGAGAPAKAQQTVLRADVFSAGAADGASSNHRIQSTVGLS
jgi:hypothetical protein